MQFKRKMERCYTAYEENGMAEAYLILLGDIKIPEPEKITLAEAVLDMEERGICFWFPGQKTAMTEKERDAVHKQMQKALDKSINTKRAIFWMGKGWESIAENMIMLGLWGDKEKKTVYTDNKCSFGLVDNLSFQIGNRVEIQPLEERVDFSVSMPDSAFEFYPKFKAGKYQILNCGMSFQKGSCGKLTFCLKIRASEFFNNLMPGLEYSYEANGQCETVYCPLYKLPKPGEKDSLLSFQVTLDPCDVCNEKSAACKRMEDYNVHRTVFDFIEQEPFMPFVSSFTTLYGEKIEFGFVKKEESLYPSRFTFSKTLQDKHHRLCPEGEFCLISSADMDEQTLLCGKSGTEYLIFQSGDKICFLSGQNAHASQLEGKSFQVGEKYEGEKQWLTDEFRTSWAGISGGSYVSEPEGFAFYGAENDFQGILSHKPAVAVLGKVEEGCLFPLMAYGQALGKEPENMERLEGNVLAKVRREQTKKWGIEYEHSWNQKKKNSETVNVVTSSGFLAEMKGAKFEKICLTCGERGDGLFFENPMEQLVTAFQSASLFLVAVNPEYLGDMDNKGNADARFQNVLKVQDWTFRVQIGYECRYGSYGGVMIIKGCKGKLFDPQDLKAEGKKKSLISNLAVWSCRNEFSSPITDQDGKGDATQQPLLVKWLEDYFRQAWEQEDKEYFATFNDIATDDNWQGVLFLRLALEGETMPAQMAGLLNGVSDSQKIYVHHLGITLNTISAENGIVKQDKNGSVFGLICYRDATLGKGAVKVVSTSNNGEEFRLLELKVLFRDSAVEKQSCKAQLSFVRLFGSGINAMEGGNSYWALLLNGCYQKRDGVQVFLLQNEEAGTFQMDSNILRSVCITGVEMASMDLKSIRFMLNGSMDFHTFALAGNPNISLDFFSYGKECRDGLVFAGAVLDMEKGVQGQVFTFHTSQMRFDLVKSRCRKGSLCAQMRLLLNRMREGSVSQWQREGYAKVASCVHISEDEDKTWLALEWKVELGTLGELAGKAGLAGSIILAWNPASQGEKVSAFIGMKMPGMEQSKELFSLQNILKLSIGAIRLEYDSERKAFLLMLNEVALKAFGVKKLPPEGSISFYLFGAEEEGSGTAFGWYGFYHLKNGKELR